MNSMAPRRKKVISNEPQHRVIIGGQWGDEGKGKAIDYFAKDADIIIRYQGGANAGHTVCFDDREYVLHLLPSGIFHADKKVALASQVVPDLVSMYEDEIKPLLDANVPLAHVYLDPEMNLITNLSKVLDARINALRGVGSTMRGISGAYGTARFKTGVSIADVVDSTVGELEEMLRDRAGVVGVTEEQILEEMRAYGTKAMKAATNDSQRTHASRFVNAQGFAGEAAQLVETLDRILDRPGFDIAEPKSLIMNGMILGEGAQGVLLDFVHGFGQYKTSSNVANGEFDIPGFPRNAEKTGVFKSYVTRVGNGPFPTELDDETGEFIRTVGGEFGATTGRPRRCGWHDTVLDKFAISAAGINNAVITKLDVLDKLPKIKIAIGSDNLPKDELYTREPEYLEVDGWEEDTTHARKITDLPINARKYLARLEIEMGIPIIGAGVGKDRKAFVPIT